MYDDYKKILDIYPDLMECHFAGKEFLGMKFKNQFIYKAMGYSIMRIFEKDSTMIWIESKDFDSAAEYVKLRLNLLQQSGYFYMDMDMHLPDEVCMFLYNMNIDIYVRVDGHSIPYDKNSIMRRNTIRNIINDQG